MLQLKIRALKLGQHMTVSFWTGKPGYTYACNGTMKFLPDEWRFFRRLLENRQGAIDTMELAVGPMKAYIDQHTDMFGTCMLCGSTSEDDCDPGCELDAAKIFMGRLDLLKQSADVLKIEE